MKPKDKSSKFRSVKVQCLTVSSIALLVELEICAFDSERCVCVGWCDDVRRLYSGGVFGAVVCGRAFVPVFGVGEPNVEDWVMVGRGSRCR